MVGEQSQGLLTTKHRLCGLHPGILLITSRGKWRTHRKKMGERDRRREVTISP